MLSSSRTILFSCCNVPPEETSGLKQSNMQMEKISLNSTLCWCTQETFLDDSKSLTY